MTASIVATAFGGPEHLTLTHAELRAPGPGEVSIRVRAAGVNPIDAKLYGGDYGADTSHLPMPLGLEVAGEVTAVGEDAVGPAGPISVGDEVIAGPISGAYADAVTVAATQVFPKPTNLTWEQASSLLLAGSTAVHALHAVGVTKGETVLIHGASGGVGLQAAQLAVHDGATVVGTTSERHTSTLRGYGVIPVLYGEGLADRVRAAAPGGVDAALDMVGTDEAVDVSLELVADRSRIATIAAFGRAAADGIKALGGAPGADPGTEVRSAARARLLALAAAGDLDVVVAHTYPLPQAADAHRLVLGGHAGGKIVLVP